jgi:basic amino acid/polyamine antiporter, APA family
VILPIAIFLALSGTLEFLAGTTATLILAMFCLVNLSLMRIKRRDPETNGFQVPYSIPAIALVFDVVLLAFASPDSHILALIFTAIGILLILFQTFWKRKQLPNT